MNIRLLTKDMITKTVTRLKSYDYAVYHTVKRSVLRLIVIAALGCVGIWLTEVFPKFLGPVGTPVLFGISLCLLGLGAGDFALRILQPNIDAQSFANAAQKSPEGAGLVYLGRCILAAVILMLMVTASRADPVQLPQNAIALLPVLKQTQKQYWNKMPMPSTLGAQVEQETCVSLKSKECWNINAKLQTSRELGRGLGQFTISYRADGSQRFDALAELTKAYPSELKGVGWDSYVKSAEIQLRVLVIKTMQTYNLIQDTASESDHLAMAYAGYNGGVGGINSDRKTCRATEGCDSSKWWGHVEKTSLKARTAIPGYGKPFFEINREYARNIVLVRRVRYLTLDS